MTNTDKSKPDTTKDVGIGGTGLEPRLPGIDPPVEPMTLDELGDNLKQLISPKHAYTTQFEKAVLNFLLVLVTEKKRVGNKPAKGGAI